jgi:hypothetical protein
MTLVKAKDQSAVRPSSTKIWLRTFFPWQLLRFLFINIRMSFMILKSHGSKNPAAKD